MEKIWHCAFGDEANGPFSLEELVALLSREAAPESVLVWRKGFPSWMQATAVPEIRACLGKPAPNVAIQAVSPEGQQDPLNSRYKKAAKSYLSLLVFLIIVATSLYLSRKTVSYVEEATRPNPLSPISGQSRKAFVESGVGACMKNQQNDPETKALSLSSDTLNNYCSCYMENLADAVTNGDLVGLVGNKLPASIEKRRQAAEQVCAEQMKRSLLHESDLTTESGISQRTINQ